MSKFSMKAAAVVAVIGGMMAGAVSASAALNLPTQSCSYVFNTNMRLGSRGTDVMNLQKVLNGYPQTQVAASGAGSPGMETSYFGPATRAAVNKFHALHLVELGITAPTGNVFAGTRALLNQICAGTTGGNTGNTGNTGGMVQSGPVSVMLAASQPSGMLVANQAGALLANLTFSGNGTVTSVELQRVGVSSDSTLTNVYLYDGNVRITDAASVVTGGYIRFNASNGLFTVNGMRNISVRADIAASTNGQSVGVKLNSVTAMGGSPSSYSNVMGNVLLIGSASPAGANFSAITSGPATVDAGTQNYKIWDGTISISTRDVNLRSATFKFVGSAPVDAVQNISLYVDGVRVAGPSMINASNNNKLTFDLGSMPYLMKTGSHTISVMGDVVKGSNRTIQMSIENVADLMMEDTSLAGVNVAATVASASLTQSNTTYNTITVNKGSVTVNVDPAFTTTRVTGGATNVPVGQFTMKAYGEDVKVNTLAVTFATTTITTLNNVSLYVNGGQVGTSQNFLGTAALTYTLGSSLIIPAGQTVTLTVKADMVDGSNAAYSAGTVAVKLGGVSNNAQGQNSNELVSVASTVVTGNTLTVSSGAGTFARTSGFVASTVSPNSVGVKIGSFTLSADAAESVRVNSIGVKPTVATYGITNISNLTLKTGSTVLGTPIGNPSTGTSTFSLTNVTVPANGTMTFDVYADIGSETSGSVTADMDISYRGSVSNTSITSAAPGVAVTSAVATLATPTLVSTSPIAQYVVGGSTFGIATFKLKTSAANTFATVDELDFTTAGTDGIAEITVAGVTKSPTLGGTTTFTGLSIANVSNQGVDVPVTVKFSRFSGAGGSLTAGTTTSITLTRVKGMSGNTVTTVLPSVSSNNMTLVASKPTVTGPASATGPTLTAGTIKIGEFTVAADSNGKIAVATTSIIISTSTAGTLTVSNVKLSDDGGSSALPYSNTVSAVSSGVAFTIGFTTPYEIAAGNSKTFSIYGTVAGSAWGSSGNTSLSTALDGTLSNFKWIDMVASTTNVLTGSGILNFGVGSYTLRN